MAGCLSDAKSSYLMGRSRELKKQASFLAGISVGNQGHRKPRVFENQRLDSRGTHPGHHFIPHAPGAEGQAQPRGLICWLNSLRWSPRQTDVILSSVAAVAGTL